MSRKTLQRALNAGEFPNAHRANESARAPWLVPVPDLIAAGFVPGAGRAILEPTPTTSQPEPAPSMPSDELREMTDALASMRHRAELAEAERDGAKARAETAELALRALTAGARPARRRWWQRGPTPDET